MRRLLLRCALALTASTLPAVTAAQGAPAVAPAIFQQPALSRGLIAFTYGGDIWTVPRSGGRATRLTTGVGQEKAPAFSPDGTTIAFTGDYDGNTDVFTVPVAGGVPRRVTYHPAADVVTGWSPDGARILFRSDRETAASRHTRLFAVAANGGEATALPLPMAHDGQLSPDGGAIAYNPLAPSSGFELNRYVSWGNYRGGRIGTIWLTQLGSLDSVRIPQGEASDFSPVFAGGRIYFLSNRDGPASIYSYDPITRAVAQVYRNDGAEIRTLATDGTTLVFDRLGEIFLLEPGGAPRRVEIDARGDMPDVRPRIANVAAEVQTVALSPTAQRVVVEAHGEILTVPAKEGPVRNLTSTPGVMEREPAWSPDGQWIAYFSDESGRYALHVAPQGGGQPLRKYPLSSDAAFYFKPRWSPDSRMIAFHDSARCAFVLDRASGRLTVIRKPDGKTGAANTADDLAWSPDSRWLVFTQTGSNRLNALFLWSVEKGEATQLSDGLIDARSPAFDPAGGYLYFLASDNAGATVQNLDMSSNLYAPTNSVLALALTATTPSPVAPRSDDERQAVAKAEGSGKPKQAAAASASRLEVDLQDLSLAAIGRRTVALPIPPRAYSSLSVGKSGQLFFLETIGRLDEPWSAQRSLNRFDLTDRKVDKLAERVESYALSADGSKLLLATRKAKAGSDTSGASARPEYAIVSAIDPGRIDPGKGALSLTNLEVRVDPRAEWQQMYREVWRIQRAYFYDRGFHGLDIDAAEARYRPYVAGVQSRGDLDYVFQEALTHLSVGHLRGSGGSAPMARRVPGGLLGADYSVRQGQWCIAKIYAGNPLSPDAAAPLAQPGVDVREGDCILAVDGRELAAGTDIQMALEGTAGRMIALRIARAGAAPHDISVVPVASEGNLRQLDRIEANRRRVDQLSGGKLGYVYLPDTTHGGLASFNRSYFAQTDKEGVVIDERFNAGGQVADYIIDVLGRRLQGWWARRQGPVHRSPAHAILGPKVMIANEMSGSGGDALPWMFKHEGLGPLVGKRTWGGLVGLVNTPLLMDGAQVTSPGVGFFSPEGRWEIENHGVEPDHVVEQDPKAVAAGHDPQLAAAVGLAMERLRQQPPPQPVVPAYPRYPDR